MAPRPYWKGYLKLSLVACPVAVFTATTSSERVSFRQINKQTGNRLRQQLVDDVTREPVDAADKIRGYEVDKNVYVQVEDEEIEALQVESNHTIDIDSFVPRAQIDERYHDSTYYIAPNDQVGREAFAVIREAMRGKDMVALGRIVLAKRERVIALQPWDKGLLGTTLRYAYEVRNAGEYFDEIPDTKIPKEMLQLAEHILESKAGDFDPTAFVDHYEEAVVDMLKRKQAGAPVSKQKAAAPASNVVNLMDALKRSVAAEKGSAKAAPGKKAKSKGKPDDLRRQPQFKFPIEGGKAKQPKARGGARGKLQGKAQAQVGLRTHAATSPQRLRRQPRALDQGAELGPGDLGVHAPAEAAVGAGDDILAADRAGKPHDPLGHQLRMLDQIGRVADHARQDHLAVRQLDVVPQLPFVLVAHVGRLERIALRLDLQHQVDDVLERQVVGVRAVPGPPAQVIAHAVFRNSLQRMVDGIDAQPGELVAILLDAERRLEHVPPVDQAGIVDLQDEAGVHDRQIFLAQRVGEREDELLVGLVVFVVDEVIEPARRDHAEERLVDRPSGLARAPP